MTYRERREAKAERLRGWAATRKARANAVFAAHEHYRGDHAFNTQPGHIPERSRVIRREERAFESLNKATSMDQRAAGIESQLASAIYSDDPDAIERLRERIATFEAERERIKAYNTSCRKGAPDQSLLSDAERADLARIRYYAPSNGAFPAYVLSNLAGNITRQRARLARLEAQS